jgi:hypothetical protein
MATWVRVPDGLIRAVAPPLVGATSVRVHAVAFLHTICGFVCLPRLRPDGGHASRIGG